jgi:hypothetical protein
MKLFYSFIVVFCLLLTGHSLKAQTLSYELDNHSWKAATDASAFLDSEQIRLNSLLALPDLLTEDRVLHTAAQRMITYIQADLSTSGSLGNLILHSYKKVISDALTVADLKPLNPIWLHDQYVPTLIEQLSSSTVAAPQSAN